MTLHISENWPSLLLSRVFLARAFALLCSGYSSLFALTLANDGSQLVSLFLELGRRISATLASGLQDPDHPLNLVL